MQKIVNRQLYTKEETIHKTIQKIGVNKMEKPYKTRKET